MRGAAATQVAGAQQLSRPGGKMLGHPAQGDQGREGSPFNPHFVWVLADLDGRRASGSGGAKLGGFIAVIESRTFIRECIRRSVQSAFAQPVLTYSTAVELEQQHLLTSAQLIIFSWGDGNTEASTNALKVLSKLAPRIPVIVLGYNNDAELAKSAICHGAKAYIPATMGFETAIAAVRFVLAGGTYAPMDCLLPRDPPGDALSQPPRTGLVTGRELA